MEIKMGLIAGGKKGKAGKIEVEKGQSVKIGDVLVNVETGKGNRPVKATVDGIIKDIRCTEGNEIVSNQVLFDVQEVEVVSESGAKDEGNGFEGDNKEIVDTDLVIIGAGPGGYVAAIYAAKQGQKVVLIEKGSLGGTCLNEGCIPTKALVKSSEVYQLSRTADLFGILGMDSVKADMKKVIQRKDNVIQTLKNGIDFLMKKNQITVLQGSASFQDQKTVAVSGNKRYLVHAKNIIVASGSKISRINIPGINLPFVLNSRSALCYDQLPSSITIIGGGVIGMEFAFLYRNLGVKVQVIEFIDRLLAMMDEDVSEEILRIAREKGIKVQLSSKVVRIQESDQGQAVVTYEKDGKEALSVSEKVLVAIGREPELEGLEVYNAGIELNDRGRGIRVNDQMQTNVSGIYAIGDVTNKIQLAHVASAQAIVAVDHILGKNICMDYSAVPNVVFTSPEIASVGFTEKQLHQQGVNISVSKASFAGNGKALTMNEAEGFVKIIKDNDSGKIVGASIIGPDAASLISTLTVAAANGLTANQISQTIFAHPTTAEVIHEAAMGLGLGAIHE